MSPRRPGSRAARPAAAAVLATALLAGCSIGGGASEDPSSSTESPTESSASPTEAGESPTESAAAAPADVPTSAPTEPDLELAVSAPVEDSVYPDVGDPRVDALHYALDLTWSPEDRRLEGTATLTFRATRTARRFQLDLAEPLEVSAATLDGAEVQVRRRGKDLVVDAPVEADGRYELTVAYAGQPGPVPAPTTRQDFSTTGFTVTPEGETWTMQEPYGAYSWYPVNDQPSDKALYDVSVHVPSPWTGVANGRLTSLETADGTTTTMWELDEPASSYLVTLAIGDYAHTSNTTEDGLRVDYWFPRGMTAGRRSVRTAAATVDWVEERLGPYPFSSLGLVVTASESAMETQTMITLGSNDYVLSEPVVAHELVHQWYGDQVSPADWSDVWLNEGMTMLMQWLYEDEHGVTPLRKSLTSARRVDQLFRDDYGPPGAYDPEQFGSSNIYYLPALMWNELRVELGDRRFFAIARSWLEKHDNQSVTRQQLYDHWEAETGRELSAFFEAWIEGRTTPAPGVPD